MASTMHKPITLRLPFAAASVAVARQRLRAWMLDMGCSSESVEDARIVVSELVANAVRHARPLADGGLVVTWTRDRDEVRISVTDGGSTTRPRYVHAPATALAGRGMAIVDALAGQWWTEGTASRSTVYVLLSV
ncbi:MAG TPA: ATP-binding protein [Nocardioidaceae bacterium]|nr:ATP-binding protein [Nocardioidaceae bacterium]